MRHTRHTLYMLLGLLLALPFSALHAQDADAVAQRSSTGEKTIFIPKDLRGMNLESDTSKWCWKRSAETRDLIFMWERGFGNDVQKPPLLEGKPMAFNLSVLMERLQTFYTFFRDTLKFSLPGSKADRYKMMVMVMYSLDGTAYGGTYDDFIGSLWVAPNRIQDKTMNCMAHELGHSFQLQIPADQTGEAWGGTGFFEMTSQWMLWQVNPWWLRDENYHFEAFKKLTHKAYLSMDNIYHSPYVIQWWSDLHGRTSIAQLYREGRKGEDPVMTYQRKYGLDQQTFCLEMLRGYQHLVNFDFKHARTETRPYACTWTTPLDTLKGGWYQPKTTLEDYGFHIIPLAVGKQPRVKVRGNHLRWALVGVTPDGQSIYGEPMSSRLPLKAKDLSKLYLVVMGAPERHQQLYRHSEEGPEAHGTPRTYPYQFRY